MTRTEREHQIARSQGYIHGLGDLVVTFDIEAAVEWIFTEDKKCEPGGKQIEIKKVEPKSIENRWW